MSEMEDKIAIMYDLVIAIAKKEEERDLVRSYGESHDNLKEMLKIINEVEIEALKTIMLSRLERELKALIDEAESMLK